MNGLRRVKPFLVQRRAVVGMIVALVPFILAACTNGSGSGPGY
jgi:hypothetical protein